MVLRIGWVAALGGLLVVGAGSLAAEQCRTAFATCATGSIPVIRVEAGRGAREVAATNQERGRPDPTDLATTVPEPASVVLLASGLVGLGLVRWRRRVVTPP